MIINLNMTEEQLTNIIAWVILILILILIVKIIGGIFRFIKWILKSIWSLITGKHTQDLTQSDDWLIRAQARQEIRFQNALPPIQRTQKPNKRVSTKKNITKKFETEKGYFSPTGWYFDKEKGEWIPPDYLVKEAKDRWEWDDQKKIWIEKRKTRKK